jgi:hypothetical protein
MIKHTKHLTLAAMSVLLSGCNECENGFKVRTEYKTIFFSESWHENPKDTFLDGAIRVTTSIYKEARALTVRCFKARDPNIKPVYDLQYTISIPLLKRIGPELEKAGAAEIVVTVDGTSIGDLRRVRYRMTTAFRSWPTCLRRLSTSSLPRKKPLWSCLGSAMRNLTTYLSSVLRNLPIISSQHACPFSSGHRQLI